jgi:hypothetical protein
MLNARNFIIDEYNMKLYIKVRLAFWKKFRFVLTIVEYF